MTQALWNAAGVVGVLALVGGVTVLGYVVRDNWRRHEAALDALLADAREKSDVSKVRPVNADSETSPIHDRLMQADADLAELEAMWEGSR